MPDTDRTDVDVVPGICENASCGQDLPMKVICPYCWTLYVPQWWVFALALCVPICALGLVLPGSEHSWPSSVIAYAIMFGYIALIFRGAALRAGALGLTAIVTPLVFLNLHKPELPVLGPLGKLHVTAYDVVEIALLSMCVALVSVSFLKKLWGGAHRFRMRHVITTGLLLLSLVSFAITAGIDHSRMLPAKWENFLLAQIDVRWMVLGLCFLHMLFAAGQQMQMVVRPARHREASPVTEFVSAIRDAFAYLLITTLAYVHEFWSYVSCIATVTVRAIYVAFLNGVAPVLLLVVTAVCVDRVVLRAGDYNKGASLGLIYMCGMMFGVYASLTLLTWRLSGARFLSVLSVAAVIHLMSASIMIVVVVCVCWFLYFVAIILPEVNVPMGPFKIWSLVIFCAVLVVGQVWLSRPMLIHKYGRWLRVQAHVIARRVRRRKCHE